MHVGAKDHMRKWLLPDSKALAISQEIRRFVLLHGRSLAGSSISTPAGLFLRYKIGSFKCISESRMCSATKAWSHTSHHMIAGYLDI